MRKLIPALLMTVMLGQQGLWQPGTAYTLPEGRWEYGLFQPVRWGQSEKREISFNTQLQAIKVSKIAVLLLISIVVFGVYPDPIFDFCYDAINSVIN